MKSKLITADMRAVVRERSQTKLIRLLMPKYLGIYDEIPLMLSGAKADRVLLLCQILIVYYYVKNCCQKFTEMKT